MGLSFWGGSGFATEGESFFTKSWMNRLMIGGDALTGAGVAMSTANDFMNDTWNQDPNAFEKGGHGAGEVGTTALMVGGQIHWATSGYRDIHSAKAIQNSGGDVFRELSGGGFKNVKTGAFHQAVEGTEGIWGRGKGGLGFSRKFIESPKGFLGSAAHMGKSIGIYMLAPMAVGMIGTAVLGFAGKYLDEMTEESRRQKAIYYDNRYIDTRKYDASSYQQIGMAMNDYSNTMQSIARVYHAR